MLELSLRIDPAFGDGVASFLSEFPAVVVDRAVADHKAHADGA